MKKYRWVLTAVFAAFLVGTSGCGKKTETIPITTISQSTDDDDPEDNLAASGDSDECLFGCFHDDLFLILI